MAARSDSDKFSPYGWCLITILKTLPWLGLVAIMAGCKPSAPPPAPSPRLIEAEPTSSTRSGDFQGCNYDPDPMLTITSKEVLLDGIFVDDAELEAALDRRQALYVLLEAPPKRDVVQVERGVTEVRVSRTLDTARAAGFVNVTRLADLDPPIVRAKKPRERHMPEGEPSGRYRR